MVAGCEAKQRAQPSSPDVRANFMIFSPTAAHSEPHHACVGDLACAVCAQLGVCILAWE